MLSKLPVSLSACLCFQSALICSVMLLLPALSRAAETAKRLFDLPADMAEKTLKLYSQQSGRALIMSAREVRGIRTKPVRGEFTPREALDRALANTGLEVVEDAQSGSLAVRQHANDPGQAAAADHPSESQKKKETQARESQGPMKKNNLFSRLAAAIALAVGPASAQVAPGNAATPGQSRSAEQTVELSPFEVRADQDTGYLATSTLAGTRLRSDLKDIAASISVVTKDFMNDVAANNLEDLLVYTVGTEVAGPGGNFTDVTPGGAGEGFNFPAGMAEITSGTRIRGLTGADLTRDFFATSIPMDGFNTDRTEISRGPNAMLFGLGSPAGIINTGLIKADLRRNRTRVKHQAASYGSNRVELDHNQMLIEDKLALRVAGMYSKQYYRIQPAYVEDRRAYLTGTYRPFESTTLRVSGEFGSQDSNKPEIRPPYDSMSYWWDIGQPVHDVRTGAFSLLSTPIAFDPRTTPAGQPNMLTRSMARTGMNNAFFYSDPNSSMLGFPGIAGVETIKPNADRVYRNAANTAWQAVSGMYALNNSNNYYNRLAAGTPSASYWRMSSLLDTNVFDYYHHQLEGPNKHEWGDWKTLNVTLEQRFLNNRAGIELGFDKQWLDYGTRNPFSYVDYNIRLDINQYLTDGRPNPNFGRPFVGGYGGVSRNSKDHEAGRATAYYDLDLTKTVRGWVGKLLGHHTLTGAYTNQKAFQEGFSGSAYYSGPDFWLATGHTLPVGSIGTAQRIMPQVRYISPSIIGMANSADVRLQPIAVSQWPNGVTGVQTLFYPSPPASATQPAQWEVRDFSVLENDGSKNIPYVTGGSRGQTRVESTVFITQSRWLQDHLVGTVGWRRDAVTISNAGTVPLSAETGAGLTGRENYPLVREPESDIADSSFNWGVVGHVPQKIVKHVPFVSGASVFYNRADNFRVAGQRFNMYGDPIGPEEGEAKEIGVRLSLLNGRFDLRVTHYENNSLRNVPGSFNTGIGNLGANVEAVLEMIAQGVNDDRPQGIAAMQTWMTTPEGQRYLKVFRFAQVAPDDWSRDTRGGQIVGTSDLVAKGWEYELVFNPLRNWRIAFNAARQEAIRTNVAPEIIDVMNNFKDLAAGPAGDLRSTPVGNFFRDRLRNNTLNVVNPILRQEGQPSSELRKWRWNLITNYSFTSGRLKGFGIGGATRLQDRGVIGFPYYDDPEFGPSPDVARPFYAKDEQNFDAWISYERKLTERINWKIQLNVRNIGVGNKLIPVSANPDGSISTWRIADPQRWTLTNTFTF